LVDGGEMGGKRGEGTIKITGNQNLEIVNNTNNGGGKGKEKKKDRIPVGQR